jgi:3-deoxy-D-manno-octulosonic-acid transferase
VILRSLYTVALYAALPLLLARLWWRGRREPRYRRRIGERFGRFRERAARPVLWIHAVSVGEARASVPLVRALIEAYPDCEALLTCMTAAGRETLKGLYGESVRVAWLPYDTPAGARRLLEHFRPRLGVLMETEIWPNLLEACGEFGVPVLLANARLSEKSLRDYARWGALARPAFARLAAVCAQSDADAARLATLGARGITVTGNLKFDAAPDPEQVAQGLAWRRALGARGVVLLASTREGEEALLLEALGAPAPDVLVAVVPRHPQRFKDVEKLLVGRGATPARRSRGETPGPGQSYFLGDTMGEMAFYFAAADVAIIGGSFMPLGGQNLIEACAVGAPVVVGPSTFNFAEATRLALSAGAALQAVDAAEAMRAALQLLGDPARRAAMGAAGKALCEAHRGATLKHLAMCRRLLEAPASPRASPHFS